MALSENLEVLAENISSKPPNSPSLSTHKTTSTTKSIMASFSSEFNSAEAKWEEIGHLDGHETAVNVLRFSPEGYFFASGDESGMVRVINHNLNYSDHSENCSPC